MRVLILSPYPEHLHEAIYDDIRVSVAPPADLPDADALISYGYRYILPKERLARYKFAINIHISLLPWNRGSDPNFWSWYDSTPKGVTIHQIDGGIDTGPILAQESVPFHGPHTLKTSYERLTIAASSLFRREWLRIRNGYVESKPQSYMGSYHSTKDRKFWYPLPQGWDTPVELVEKMGAVERAARESWF